MAKFNITVELDWIEEDGSIDNAVKEEIVSSISRKFSKEVTTEITKKVQDTISKKVLASVDTQVNKITEDLLNKKFDITDNWGDVKESQVSVIELLKKRLDNYLEEKVDRDGRVSSYNGTKRIDQIIQNNIDYTMKSKIDQAAKEIKKGLENYMETTLKTQIGENVVKIIGLDKIISK